MVEAIQLSSFMEAAVMKAVTIAQMTVRVAGVLLVLLGIYIWTRNGDQVIPVHEFLGFVLVLGLWTLAFIAARAGVVVGLVVAGFVWGLIAPVLGLTQDNLLTGNYHWAIQVVHLVIGLGAIGIAERLAMEIKARRAVPATA
ncbi:MAG: hypothetical protein ABI334_02500 [Candidatus Dormiibacterota bacterium]